MTDLMLNDWVEVQDSPMYYQVKCIDTLPKGIACRLGYDDYVVDTWCDRVSPIHLTDEILVLNGWKYDKLNNWYSYEGVDFKVSLGGHNGFCAEPFYEDACQVFECDCVSELQHALRINRYKELADNFKVYNE